MEPMQTVAMRLNPNQIDALEALVSSRTITEAADKVGVTPKTLHLWMKEPSFRAAYSEVKRELFDDMTRRLLGLGDQAIDAYQEILRAPNMPGSYTLAKVADSLLNQIFRLREISDMDERLSAIEERLREISHEDL